ncbi:MAG: hypothetical protein AB8B55_09645 [Mariniblastus sp.]
MIPKFTIRQMLFAMIAVGLISAFMAGASRGNRSAFALSVATFATVIPFLIYAVVHWSAFAVARVSEVFFASKFKTESGLPPPIGSPSLAGQSLAGQSLELKESAVPLSQSVDSKTTNPKREQVDG